MNKLSKFIKRVLFDKLVILCHCLDLDHRETIVRNLFSIVETIVGHEGVVQPQVMKSLGSYRYSVNLLLLEPIDWLKQQYVIDESVNDNKKTGHPSEKWQLIVKIVD
ncbi:hypothetical protein RJP56_11305 [Shewanella baltica]|jgi:hypothetical protein|uniref:hypothetical protein n=1 Tax=Shewanella baltica TaxID=62322 RepID=UPI00287118A5|nr:hypothetical protein [Shewanella baltica]MDR9766642.1 hypothetical protein [Shewanella baltica]